MHVPLKGESKKLCKNWENDPRLQRVICNFETRKKEKNCHRIKLSGLSSEEKKKKKKSVIGWDGFHTSSPSKSCFLAEETSTTTVCGDNRRDVWRINTVHDATPPGYVTCTSCSPGYVTCTSCSPGYVTCTSCSPGYVICTLCVHRQCVWMRARVCVCVCVYHQMWCWHYGDIHFCLQNKESPQCLCKLIDGPHANMNYYLFACDSAVEASKALLH